MKTRLVYTDREILEYTTMNQPALIAVDVPLSLPAKGEAFRNADVEKVKKGLTCISSNLPRNENAYPASNKTE